MNGTDRQLRLSWEKKVRESESCESSDFMNVYEYSHDKLFMDSTGAYTFLNRDKDKTRSK